MLCSDEAPLSQMNGQAMRSSPKPLKLTFFDQEGDGSAAIGRQWIMKGLFARGETSSLVGPPGSGKSALATEIGVHCAAGIDWHGHKAKASCGVLILALERGDLYRRRLQAYRQRDDGLKDLPIAVAASVIDILKPETIDRIVATIIEAERHFECGVGVVIIDTFSKALAAGGGDENTAKDQNRAAALLRLLHERLTDERRPGVHIMLIGHTGRNERKGARGSNAHEGDVDLMVQIRGKKEINIAEVVKANDQPERIIAEFRLETVQLGFDQDNDPITTAIVTPDQAGAPFGAARSKSKSELKGKPLAGLRVLRECVADGEAPRPADEHAPASAKGVTMSTWRHRLEEARVINPEGNPRQEFRRIHVTLKELGWIDVCGDYAWPVT